MNKRAFTLVELLVVVGIMGLLGTVSVGGYRAMQRGMEERGVMENVNTLVRTAFERAQIDRQPTIIYFWNETLKSSMDNAKESDSVVGHAVAVRRHGRISGMTGSYLLDEFGDLEQVYTPSDPDKKDANDNVNTMLLYNMDDLRGNDTRRYSVVGSQVELCDVEERTFPHGRPQNNLGDNGEMKTYAFRRLTGSPNEPTWHIGSAYGFEFAEITLPRNYIFGNSYSTTVSNPIKEMPNSMYFKVGLNMGEGVQSGGYVEGSVSVYSLRPNASGKLEPMPVKTVEKPN